ncbi:SAV_2336 N-terminal domain-related protein [Arthrospira platensis NCB002]|uniref:SAV_2336 N-terminal domain-related protein n=1 Tax=Limnospira platensis TaxID=118562 RepID=UPI0001D0F18A|nr:SAV_2336 N-terminal domain-related protein [Arthrospira platensis NCB002]BAI91155.1 TPR domain protein [Arthrospira platensis NIES-39]BDT13486.1 TPR domain protein [Arthrospira platensis NIES-39]
MNPNLVQALQQEFQLSAKDIADIFWLASHIDQYSESVTPAKEPSPSPSAEPSSDSSSSSQTPPESPPQPVSQADNPKNPPENSPEDKSTSSVSPQPPQAEIVPKPEPSQTAAGGGGLSIRLSDAPSLREPLTLARALKPLMRRVSGGRDWVIDEVATSEQIASQGIWLPVLRPRLEPWLDLDLVIEDCVSMLLWRHTLRDLEKLLKNYGIFRDVRVWSLLTDNPEAVKIRRGIGATAKHQAPRSPRELIDPTGRRLVIVVSDCVSKVWREGKMTPILDLWAKRGSMAILQMLPEWMWKRSGLGWEALVRLQGLNPGDWNQNLKVDEFPLWWDEEVTHQVVKVPIFTLEPESVGSWARLVAGKGNVWAAGYLFKYAEHQRRRQRPNSGGELTAEKRVNGFRATASRVARKLAGLLAAAPVITLPVVRLIQETLLRESLQVNVAEVFLGGLLKPISEIDMETDSELVQYDFMPGVRELLLESVPVDETVRVIDEISRDVAKKLGFANVKEFGAILRNPQQLGEGEVQGNAIAFARVTAQVLRSLGGAYIEFAEELESSSVVEEPPPPTEEPEPEETQQTALERFWLQLLQAEREGDTAAVHQVMRENMELIVPDLGDVIAQFVEGFLEQNPDQAEEIARLVENTCISIQEFPEGRYAEVLEIAIRGYDLLLALGADNPAKARTLTNLGNVYRNQAELLGIDPIVNLEKAIAAYDEAAAIRRRLGLDKDLSVTLTNLRNALGMLGDIQRKWGRWEAAETLYRQCLAVETELGDQPGMATTWGSLGDIEKLRGNWDEAERLYRQSLELRAELDDRSGMASCWGQLGDIQRNWGNWDEAERLYRQSLELRAELGDRSGVASSWGQLGDIQRNRGNWDEAERLYLQCLELRTELGDRSGMASCWGQLGDIQRNRGNWDEAEHLYRQCLEVMTELGDRSGMASCWGQLGDIQRNRGNWDEAERLYRQSLELRNELGDRSGMASCWGQLGDIQRNRGNWDEAERLYLQCLELMTELGDRSGMASCWGQLGDIYRNRGNWDEAERLYRQSLELRTELGDRSGMASCWGQLGDIYRNRGNWYEAERLYRQSLELRTELGDRLGMGISYNSLAFVHRQLNKIPEAIAAWRAGLAICSPDRFPLEALELGRNLGNIAFDLQNWETTIEGYNQAILAIEQSRYWATSEATKRELVANSLDIYENMVQACINNQDYPQALLTVERSKSRTLLELLDSANLYPKNATNAQKQRISDLRRQIGSYQQQLAYTPTTENNLNQPSPETLIRQQLQSANEQLQDLLTELDDPNFTLTAQVPAQLPDLRRLLPPQTALIEWYLPSEAESGFYAFLVTRRRDQQIQITPHHFSAEDRQHLDQALEDYRRDYRRPSWNQQLPQRLETLSAALQLPRLLAELSQIQHLIMIPHRELHLIPLHALPVSLPSPSGSETKPLQDWFPVQYAPSCQILNYLQNLPPVNREIAPFFAIQNPTEDLDYENLGVELLCRKFSPYQVLRHDQATLANLTEPDTQTFLEQSHAVHFACHGEFDVCNPLNAYLRLANGEKLTFVDIVTSLSLPVCRLLVLCSSQTGLVETSLTDDYVGLSSAFLLTGARTVVASLWNVDELAATLVTLRLYQILPDYPSVTVALQAAQTWLRGLSCDDVLDWLKHEFKATEEELEEVEDRLSLFDDPPFESPHYWAAFVAIAGPSG